MESMYIISFNSTHHAMRAEKLIKAKSFNIGILPTPREISASCGLSIKFDEAEVESIKKIILENNLECNGIYKITKADAGKRVVYKIGF